MRLGFLSPLSGGSYFLAPDELAQKTMARIANTPAAIASTNPIVKFMSPSFLTPLL